MEPGFLLSYWRPWDENSSFVDSWGDYLRNTELVRYGADRVGDFIQQASRENVRAIQEASDKQARVTIAAAQAQIKAIQEAAQIIGFKLDGVTDELRFMNRRMDVAMEQQRLNQLSLEELLRIPDSEKERLKTIKQGVHFFITSQNDPDLLDNALQEFLKAEQMKPQDYFVLHKIGSIYLYSKAHLNPAKALEYFVRAGKFAVADAKSDSSFGSNKIKDGFDYIDSASDKNQILLLASAAYDKAALASYILGDDNGAVQYQIQAVEYHWSGETLFNLAKYQFRIDDVKKAIQSLSSAIDANPYIINAVFCDGDIITAPAVPELIKTKYAEIENSIEEAIIDILPAKDAKDPLVKLKQSLIAKALSFQKKHQYADAFRLVSFLSAGDKELERIAQMKQELSEADLKQKWDSPEEMMTFITTANRVSLENAKSIDEFYDMYNSAKALLGTNKKQN